MARIRTIKPDAFISESLCRVSIPARWTFAGLWTYADDYGRARDDLRLIKAALFVLDDHVSLQVVASYLDELVNEDCVCRYEVDGKRYLHMPNWSSHQRVSHPTPSKFPTCPNHSPETLANGSGAIPEKLTNGDGTIRRGKERKGKERISSRVRATTDAKATEKRATQIPQDWTPKPDHIELAIEYGVDPEAEVRKFRAYHEAKGSTYKRWDAAFRLWLNNAREYRGGSGQPNGTKPSVPSPVAPRHLPVEVPADLDPDDPVAYAKWAREAAR